MLALHLRVQCRHSQLLPMLAAMRIPPTTSSITSDLGQRAPEEMLLAILGAHSSPRKAKAATEVGDQFETTGWSPTANDELKRSLVCTHWCPIFGSHPRPSRFRE